MGDCAGAEAQLETFAADLVLVFESLPQRVHASTSAGDPLSAKPEVRLRDVPVGNLFPGQSQGRTLPLASARFAMQPASVFAAAAA